MYITTCTFKLASKTRSSELHCWCYLARQFCMIVIGLYTVLKMHTTKVDILSISYCGF